jgi:hypothetical protein
MSPIWGRDELGLTSEVRQDISAVFEEPGKAKDAGVAGATQHTIEKVQGGCAKQFTIPPAIAKALGMTVNKA